jgi:hypothetical protein
MLTGGTFSISNEYYYDKITGLLVESICTVSGELSPYPNGTKASYIQMLTSTTAFTALDPEESTTARLINAAGIAVVAGMMVAAAITQRRQQKTTINSGRHQDIHSISGHSTC